MSEPTTAGRALAELPHYATDDDPLNMGLICVGDMEDWPCPFEQGRRSGVAAYRADLAARVRALYSESETWLDSEFWVDGKPYVKAAAVLAEIEKETR